MKSYKFFFQSNRSKVFIEYIIIVIKNFSTQHRTAEERNIIMIIIFNKNEKSKKEEKIKKEIKVKKRKK
jgi:hypothetical protein